MHDERLSSLLLEVINGYSEIVVLQKKAYLKHLDLSIELGGSSVYRRCFDQYKQKGLPSEEEKLEELEKEGEWTKADESFIHKNRRFLKNLRETEKKLVLEAQKSDIQKTIKETEAELIKKIVKRESLIGATCEKYAEKKKQEFVAFSSLFKDKDLSEPLFSDEEWEYLERSEVGEILEAINNSVSIFSEKAMKELCTFPLFFNFFTIGPKDNPSVFFKKNPKDLTFYQQKITVLARTVRSILENVPNVPDEITDSYDDLLEFSRRSRDSGKRGKSNVGYSIVGAKKGEMKKAGAEIEGAISPHELLRKSGKKTLGKRDFIDNIK